MLLVFLCTLLDNVQYIIKQVVTTDITITFFSPFDVNILYILLGYEMSLLMKSKLDEKPGEKAAEYKSCAKSNKIKAFIIMIAMNFLMLILCYIYKNRDFFSIKTVMVIVSSVCCFYIIMNIKIKEGLKRTIFFVADKTFYIYLLHYMIIRKIHTMPWFWEMTDKIKGIGTFILISFITVTVSFVIAIIMKLIGKTCRFMQAII